LEELLPLAFGLPALPSLGDLVLDLDLCNCLPLLWLRLLAALPAFCSLYLFGLVFLFSSPIRTRSWMLSKAGALLSISPKGAFFAF